MNKKIITKIVKKTINNKARWYTEDQVFKKATKTSSFKNTYKEEILRLHIAQQIRHIRTTEGLTQKAVAQRAGMTQSVVARIEQGENGISVDTLGRVVNALGRELYIS